jgi:inorganic pyrophosphatase
MHYFLTYKNLPDEPAKCRIHEVYGAEHAREVILASKKDYETKYGG